MFLATHYVEEAEELADIVGIIIDGTIRTMDTTRNLINMYKQIKYDELELKKSSLEDVFLDLTAANQEEVLETVPD